MSTLSSFSGACHRLIAAEAELVRVVSYACQVKAAKEIFRESQEKMYKSRIELSQDAFKKWQGCHEEVGSFCADDDSGWGEINKFPDMIYRGFFDAVANESDFKYHTFVGVVASLGIYTIYDDLDCWKGKKDGHRPSYNWKNAEISIANQIEHPFLIPNTEMGKMLMTILNLTASAIKVNSPYRQVDSTNWPLLLNWQEIEYAKPATKLYDNPKFIIFQTQFTQWMSETRVHWFYLLHNQIKEAASQAYQNKEAGEQDTRPNVAIHYPTPQPSQPKKTRSWWLRW